MHRRLFLRHAALATTALAALPLSVCSPPESAPSEAAPPAGEASGGPLHEATLADLQAYQQQGRYSARQLTELYLQRIEALNHKGPTLRAVLSTNPEALRIADALDQERRAGRVRGPLHGIPILLKDNIDTGDSQFTTAGALVLARHRARQDAFIVRQLRAAGAVLLGKANLSEWSNFRSTSSSNGWSTLGGQTRNPYVLDRSPNGSSSGSAVAAAANLCAAAVGTETDGSVVSPASACGLVGLKPTVGLLSRAGIIPISSTQDTAGPLARTVRDAALLLGALAGPSAAPDPADPATAARAGQDPTDYTAYLQASALQGQRLGVEKSHLRDPSAAGDLLRQAVAELKKLGATLVEVELPRPLKPIGEAEMEVLLHEFKDSVNRYLAAAGAPVKSLAEVIAFNRKHEARVMPYFEQELLERAEQTTGLGSARYRAALARSNDASRRGLDQLFTGLRLAALVGITAGPAWSLDLVHGDSDAGPSFTTPAATAGYPHLTVPMGQVHGLPVGLSFVGPAWSEARLLGLGYAYEQATGHRRAPAFRAGLAGQ
ncbi:amidase [Hymenobacter oligotrophus]|uniref:Amidase n=1 Tax=Hymenobacter oligotrophus TaxID=2319843 RepID=A0A3B7QZL6_9BACT|nr:amidase [Hymenobacter oligotrophus]AYA36450.1 amidase [Hymenobacter oligotrophus]